jgi:hypothetical protein
MHNTNLANLLATGTREDLLAYCIWNDRNGVWTDEDCAAEDMAPPTIEELRAIIADWAAEDAATG